MTAAFTPSQALDMRRDYERGLSFRAVGDKYYCSVGTARKYVLMVGGKPRSKLRYRKHEASIQHDWNAGISAKRIAMVYQFPGVESLHSYIKAMRKRGIQLVKRGDGARMRSPRYREGELVALWNAGRSVETIAWNCGLRNPASVYGIVHRLRGQGVELRARQGGRRNDT